ncbi:MAG: M48 family metallopeptidase [Candidatus Kuenenia sp.]|nr:M48 family metallopeptidase [Candidatus Kuenenia hertensis]
MLTKRQYISGESYYYLGRQYRLKVQEDTERSVKLIGKCINNEFYKLIERHMPDWKLRKDRLEKILI